MFLYYMSVDMQAVDAREASHNSSTTSSSPNAIQAACYDRMLNHTGEPILRYQLFGQHVTVLTVGQFRLCFQARMSGKSHLAKPSRP